MRFLPVCVAAVMLLFFGPIGWWSKDFGVFMLRQMFGVHVLLMLFTAAVAIFIWAIVEKRWPRRISLLATVGVIAVVPPALLNGLPIVRDPLEFYVWYYTHPETVKALASRNDIVMYWDGWGVAGITNDSFLVSNPDDSISTTAAATTWAQRFPSRCDIVATQRMKAGFYLLTTADCVLP